MFEIVPGWLINAVVGLLVAIFWMLYLVFKKLKRIGEAMTDLITGEQDLANAVDAQTAQAQQIVTAFKTLNDEITALIVAGQGATGDELEAFAQKLQAAQAVVATALAPAQPPAPAPAS